MGLQAATHEALVLLALAQMVAQSRGEPGLPGDVGLWQQGQRLDVARADDREVASVERGDLGDSQALGGDDDRGVDRAQRQVAVSPDELRDAKPVGGCGGLDQQFARIDIAEEPHLVLRARARPQQLDRLGHHEVGYHQGPGMTLEQLEAGMVRGLPAIDVGDERPRVDDQDSGPGMP